MVKECEGVKKRMIKFASDFYMEIFTLAYETTANFHAIYA
jgi:hypothetical protein